MVEESVWSSNNTDYNVAFPVIAPKNSIFKSKMKDVDFLEKVRFAQMNWVENGTNVELCVHPKLRHNISNTVTVSKDKWDDVTKYLFENSQYFSGVSFLADSGDKDYFQAPFTEVLEEKDIIKIYGVGSMFASGLIVDHIRGFKNLWEATSIAQSAEDVGDQESVDNRAEWIRRFKNYAENYFGGSMKQAEYCLKDVYLLHKWHKIQQNFKDVNFVDNLEMKKYIDIDTMGSAACIGGACELI